VIVSIRFFKGSEGTIVAVQYAEDGGRRYNSLGSGRSWRHEAAKGGRGIMHRLHHRAQSRARLGSTSHVDRASQGHDTRDNIQAPE
jgi:hypothetical protein